jgi:CHAD domain-containing protein
MAYRIRRSESVGTGLRRVARTELRSAIDALDVNPSADSIHTARKSIKKLRAVLTLVGDDAGARGETKVVRGAGRQLSPLRDADAVIESAKALCARNHWALSGEACASLSEALAAQKKIAAPASDIRRVARRVGRTLRRADKSVRKLNWTSVRFRDLSAGLRQRYKQARRDMRRARKSDRAEDFHTWRKRVKTVWYGLRLLQRRLPLERQLAPLERLETLLGDDHNLVVLALAVESNRTSGELREFGPRLTRLAQRRQKQLRRKALAIGRRLFDVSPKAFDRRLRRLWAGEA